MEHNFGDGPDWRNTLEPAYLLYKDGEAPGEQYYPHIRRPEDEMPNLSAEEEDRLMNKQVEDSEGFDIDFTKFRCVFNYQPLDLDDSELDLEPETTREFLGRLSRGSLEGFNGKYKTRYEFVEVIKANYHTSAGLMFYITFKGKLLSDDESKHFRAKVCNCYSIPDYISCELKPEKKVHSIEAAEKEDPKKPRLTDSHLMSNTGGDQTQALL